MTELDRAEDLPALLTLERVAQEWSMQQPEFAEGLVRLRQRIDGNR